MVTTGRGVSIMSEVPLYSSFETASERRGNNSKVFKDFSLKNGSSQGQSLALAVLYVPSLLDSGTLICTESHRKSLSGVGSVVLQANRRLFMKPTSS